MRIFKSLAGYIPHRIHPRLIFLLARLLNLRGGKRGPVRASPPSFYVALASCQTGWQNCEMRYGIDFILLLGTATRPFLLPCSLFLRLLCKPLTPQTCVTRHADARIRKGLLAKGIRSTVSTSGTLSSTRGGGELFKPWPRFSTSTRRFLLIAKSEAKESGEHVRNDGPSDASAEN